MIGIGVIIYVLYRLLSFRDKFSFSGRHADDLAKNLRTVKES